MESEDVEDTPLLAHIISYNLIQQMDAHSE